MWLLQYRRSEHPLGMAFAFTNTLPASNLTKIMPEPNLSIVIPMYNESGGIRHVLDALLSLFATTLSHLAFEIIVVDDGSSDDSAAQVLQVAHPAVRLCQHPYNIGNGAAVKTGIRHAQGEYILLMDADGQHKPEDIPRLLEHIGRYDMVVGARTGESETAVHRDIANFIYNTFASYICGSKIEDLTSGFRVIKADIAKKFLYLLPNTFSYPTTLTLAVVRAGYSLQYVPIIVRKRVGKSKIKLLRDGSRFFLIMFKIATIFSPLKIFIPAGILMFLVGFGYGLFKVVFLNTRYGPTSAMLMTMSVIIFMVGLVSEQVAQLRFDRSEQ
jgi:glycosyltransferase involved in cell wall biosynthesis